MAARRLLVVLYGEVIGRLDQATPSSDVEFSYDDEHLERGAVPLGLRLPIAGGPLRGRNLRAYLEGILPEDADTRRRWAADLGVSYRRQRKLFG